MKLTIWTFVVLGFFLGNSVASEYANVKGWEIRQVEYGCVADHPGRDGFQWSILVAPVGNWETHIVDLDASPLEIDFPTKLVIADNSFDETYFGDAARYIGVLPLEQRLALAKGNNVSIHIDGKQLDFSLMGSTAVMLKLEECWHQMTGYDPSTSSKRGSYAFK